MSFVGGDDPAACEAVGGPHESTIPWRANCDDRLAVVVDGDRLSVTDFLWCDERDEECVATNVAPRAQLEAILNDAVDYERHLQIDLHLAVCCGPEDAVCDRVVADDAAIGRIDFDV